MLNNPLAGAFPPAGQQPVNPPASQPPVTPPPAAGGFNWGLTPGADAVPPATPVTPPAQPYIPPAAPSVPPAPTEPPTAAFPWNTPQQPAAAEPPTAAFPWDTPQQPTEPEPPTAAFPWNTPPQPAEPQPPTAALPWETPASPDAATELIGQGPASADGSSIDSLFGETQFKDYEGEPLLAGSPFVAPRAEDGTPLPAAPRAPLPRNQKVLLWVAGGLVAVLALLALFFVGTKLPDLLGPAPAVASSATPSITPTPTATAKAVGPLAPGDYKWNQLLGGECLGSFQSPWAEKFTVVDCATPHAAQMVYRGTFPPMAQNPTGAATGAPTGTATAPAGGDPNGYPGIPGLQSQINLLCTAPGVINLATAGQYNDIQFQAAYAATEQDWSAGDHDYYCFVNRSGGDPITGSLAVAATPAAG